MISKKKIKKSIDKSVSGKAKSLFNIGKMEDDLSPISPLTSNSPVVGGGARLIKQKLFAAHRTNEMELFEINPDKEISTESNNQKIGLDLNSFNNYFEQNFQNLFSNMVENPKLQSSNNINLNIFKE